MIQTEFAISKTTPDIRPKSIETMTTKSVDTLNTSVPKTEIVNYNNASQLQKYCKCYKNCIEKIEKLSADDS
jgi:hypothetical protein